MKTSLIALALAAAASMAVTPALAHCGGSHGNGYRAAQVKKPAQTRQAAARPAAPKDAAAVAPGNQVGQPGPVASAPQSAADGSGATF
jgi:hypothetical protein